MSDARHRLRSRRSLIAPTTARTNTTVHPRIAQDVIHGANETLVVPPVDARIQTTACAFCIVGCGYKVYSWPLGRSGGPNAAENALGIDLPAGALQGWFTRSMHNIVDVDGQPHHVVVMPDYDAETVNLGGDHSLGGTLARRLYSPYAPATSDRLLVPQLRVDGKLRPISWDDALAIVAEVGRHVVDQHGPLAWGMKTYSYQFYENTYAITKLAFAGVGTPCWAPHDQPRDGSSTPGLSDAGVDAFSAAYADWAEAEVIFVSGVSLYAAKPILFSQWVQRGGARLVVVNTRRDETAEYALRTGGLFLQVRPGTDTLLHNAIARVVLDEGWEDAEFIAKHVVTDAEEVVQETEGKWRRERFCRSADEWAAFIQTDDRHLPERAEDITGVPASAIREAARMLAAPNDAGARPRASFMLEKGNIFGHNYPATASLVSLGLLCGAGNRPGQVISRAGGHQRGMIQAASYPTELSPDTIDGQSVPLDLDRWTREGNLRMAWVIGCTWAGGGTAAPGRLFGALWALAREASPQVTDADAFPGGSDTPLDRAAVITRLRERADGGGTVLIQQDIYPQDLTELADVVLPALSWGEETFTRMQGERRLRLYPRIADPPGDAKPDWWIVAEVAKRMGYEGFDWPSSEAIFVEAAEQARGSAHDYSGLVELAEETGESAYALLAARGTTGLQCPAIAVNGEITQTVRLHDAAADRGFKTAGGKAMFVEGSWDDVVDRHASLLPAAGELWIINRRDSRTWSAMIEDVRIPVRLEQMPEHRLEIHPDDAAQAGVADGDPMRVVTGDLEFEARAELTDRLLPGVACAYFNYTGSLRTAANNAVADSTDPISGLYAFKLGRGRVERR